MLEKFESLWLYGLFSAIILAVANNFINSKFVGYLIIIGLCCCIPFTLWLIWGFIKCVFGLIFSGELSDFIKGILLAAVLIFPTWAFMVYHLYAAVVSFVMFLVFIIYLFKR